MSYIQIPSRYSLGAAFDVSAEIRGRLPPVPGGLPTLDPQQTMNQIAQSSPTMQGLADDWGPSLEIAGNFGISFAEMDKNPAAAVQFMMQALPSMMDMAGVGGTAADIASVAAGYAPGVAALIGGDPGPLVKIGIKTGAAYGCKQLGIPPDISNITADAIFAGEISNKTLEAAGGMGGAVGGAALCSLIGVPPCIGGFLGGQAGKAIGGVVAGILDIGIGKDEREAKRKARAQLEGQIRGQLAGVRQNYIQMVLTARGQWWTQWDYIIDMLSMQWQGLECSTVFGNFPLLWSGHGTVNPYFLYPYNTSLCARPLNQNLSRGTGCLNSKGLLASVTESGCPQPYGCPYPTFPTLGDDPSVERVRQAFAAYDIWWVPGPERKAIDEQWVKLLASPDSKPRDPNVNNNPGFRGRSWTQAMASRTEAKSKCSTTPCRQGVDRDLSAYMDWYKADLKATADQALSTEGIGAAVMRITGDLCTTAGIYVAAQLINSSRSLLTAKKYTSALAKSKNDANLIISQNELLMNAVTTGKRKNAAVNYGMLAMGALLLGGAAATWRDR